MIPFLATVAREHYSSERGLGEHDLLEESGENDRIDDEISSLHNNPLDPFRTFVVEMRRGGAYKNKSRRLFTLPSFISPKAYHEGFASVTFAALGGQRRSDRRRRHIVRDRPFPGLNGSEAQLSTQ